MFPWQIKVPSPITQSLSKAIIFYPVHDQCAIIPWQTYTWFSHHLHEVILQIKSSYLWRISSLLVDSSLPPHQLCCSSSNPLCWLAFLNSFGWNRARTSFYTSSPSSIKDLLPSGLKLVLTRTTRLHSSTNSLKCAKLQDCYEYGLETQANSSQTYPTREFVCTLFSQRIVNREWKTLCRIRTCYEHSILFLHTVLLLLNSIVLKRCFFLTFFLVLEQISAGIKTSN